MFQPTEAQIADWKTKHSKIYLFRFDDKCCYVRRPTRQELSYATKTLQDNPLKFAEMILKSIWLGGDEEIKTDDVYFFGVTEKLSDLIKSKTCELVNL